MQLIFRQQLISFHITPEKIATPIRLEKPTVVFPDMDNRGRLNSQVRSLLEQCWGPLRPKNTGLPDTGTSIDGPPGRLFLYPSWELIDPTIEKIERDYDKAILISLSRLRLGRE